MTAPCLLRLDKEISEAASEVAKAQLLAEKACYLARIGKSDEADSIRLELRGRFGAGQTLGVTVRLMVLEGVLGYFRSLGGSAGDRILRANFLSVAAGDKALIAYTSAWLSHFHYYDGKYRAAVEAAKQAIENVERGESATLIRIGLLFGDMFLLVGDAATSQNWYEVARQSAVDYGDQAAIGALTYNRASLKVFNLRVARALGIRTDGQLLKFANAECRSASNYHVVTGVKSLEHLLTSSQISLDILNEKYREALDLLLDLFATTDIPASYPYRSVLRADMVLCHARVGNEVQAKKIIQELQLENLKSLPVDDALIVFGTLHESASIMPNLGEEWLSSIDLADVRNDFLRENAQLQALLIPFKDIPIQMRTKE